MKQAKQGNKKELLISTQGYASQTIKRTTIVIESNENKECMLRSTW